MNRFAKSVLDEFARREGFCKKSFPSWESYKAKMLAFYRTGLGGSREHPTCLKDLEELAGIAARKRVEKKRSKAGAP